MTNAQEPRTPTIAAQIEALARVIAADRIEYNGVQDDRSLAIRIDDEWREWASTAEAMLTSPAIVTALRQAEAAPAADACEWQMVNRLRDQEADSVNVLCDNPDGPPNNAVECCGFWTGFAERRFEGETISDALRKAVSAKDAADRDGHPEIVHVPSADAALVEALRKAVTMMLWLERGIKIDIGSCHSARGQAASFEMRSDDREFRSDIEAAFDALRAALALASRQPVGVPEGWQRLSTDYARLAMWKAIDDITIGNATDDKLIIANLAKQGVYLAALPAAPAIDEGEKA